MVDGPVWLCGGRLQVKKGQRPGTAGWCTIGASAITGSFAQCEARVSTRLMTFRRSAGLEIFVIALMIATPSFEAA